MAGSLLAAALMAAGLFSAGLAVPALSQELPPGGTFIDDDGDVHEPNIEAIAAAEITNGCQPSRFCPNLPVTRAQMGSFLARALDLPIPSGNRFADVSGSHLGSINAIAEAGISLGCDPDGTLYCPDDFVTRAQMASFVARALELAATGSGPFTDVGGVHAANIAAIAEAGITLGCNPGGTLYCPLDLVSRAQMATFLTRGLGLTPLIPPPRGLPVAGNPNGNAAVPADGQAEDVSSPDHVVGSGTPASCTSEAFVAAVAAGGTIVFDCGPGEHTIALTETARVFNNADPDIVIDGGGLITLSGMSQRRIIYMNACDPDLVWTTPHCNDQDHPRLTVQNLTFVDGNSTGADPDGGGAIWARGGKLKVVNSRFFNNTCDGTGPDVGGAAIRAFDQSNDEPIYVVQSTFGGFEGLGNICSNGGAVSAIGVSYTIINSLFTHNEAIGWGANPAQGGTPGGGNGGAIYGDGNTFVYRIIDTVVEDNIANEGGGGIFFVSNNRTGNLYITDSELRRNPSLGFETTGYPGIFYLGSGPPIVTGSILEP